MNLNAIMNSNAIMNPNVIMNSNVMKYLCYYRVLPVHDLIQTHKPSCLCVIEACTNGWEMLLF